MRQIYFEPQGYVDRSQREMFDDPPDGYRFVLPNPGTGRRLLLSDAAITHLYPLAETLFRAGRVPYLLLKSRLDSRLRRPPPDAAITYAYNHLVFRDEPWVCQVEYPTMLVGRDAGILRRWRHVLERSFSAETCRKVIVWGRLGEAALRQALDCRGFAHKIETVPLVVRRRDFVKRHGDTGRVKLMFVGSGNRSGEFHAKGGKEAITAFERLAARYPNLSLVIRSDAPREWKERARRLPDTRVIDRLVPWPELEHEYQTADIFVHTALFPGYHVAPLDAMSYELPVVATDYGDCREKVEDGVTGFLVPQSERIPEVGEYGLPPRQTSLRGQVLRAYREVDGAIVDGIVDRCSILIDDAGLRRRLGAAGRSVVDDGPLSVAHRNATLKRIFDDAVAPARG